MRRIIIPVCIALAVMLALFFFNPINKQNYISENSEIQIKSSEIAAPPEATRIIFVKPEEKEVDDAEKVINIETFVAEPEENQIIFETEETSDEGIFDTVLESEEEYIETSEESEEISEEASETDEDLLYLGVWTTTAYCQCPECCGSWSGGPTASGTWPEEGRTVAADLPFGTQLLINGNVYTVEDRGVYGEWVDIFFYDHDEADAYGMRDVDVYLVQ